MLGVLPLAVSSCRGRASLPGPLAFTLVKRDPFSLSLESRVEPDAAMINRPFSEDEAISDFRVSNLTLEI